jgi:hypothetical protein
MSSTRALAALLLCASATAAPQPPLPPEGNKFPLAPAGGDELLDATTIGGSLAVRAVQGGPGGAAIGGLEVDVQLVHRGAVVHSTQARLDEHGVVVLEDLPVGMGVTPIVRVTYAGVTYQQPGTLMDASNRHQTVEVVCYELSSDEPSWRVAMRHVMIDAIPGGLRVAEIVVVENPASTTWLGRSSPGARPVTTAFRLPPGASNVSLGKGFHDWCCTTFADGTLSSHLPLMPQRTELHFGYLVPARDGAVSLEVRAPAPVDHMMVVIPEELETASVEGLALGGTEPFGDRAVRYYRAAGLPAGAASRLVLSGLRGAAAATTEGKPASPARVIAAIGGALLVLTALAVLLLRPRPAPTPSGNAPLSPHAP